MKAWHFLKEDMKGGYGIEPPWKDGEEREVEGELVPCARGYHASTRLVDALHYARGSVICRVEISGEIIRDTDKMCAQRRKLLWHIPPKISARILHEFGCLCAERALQRERKAGREPAKCSWAAVEAKRLWMRGDIGDKQLEAAVSSAWAISKNATDAAVDICINDRPAGAAWAIARAAWAAFWAANSTTVFAFVYAHATSAKAAKAAGASCAAERKWQERTLRRLLRTVAAVQE